MRSTLDDQTAVAVTIYNENLALIKDRRQLELPAGASQLEFRGVSARMDADGRSRATRRTVLPDEVKQVMALAPMTDTMLLAASASASAVVGSGRVSVKCSRAR